MVGLLALASAFLAAVLGELAVGALALAGLLGLPRDERIFRELASHRSNSRW